jgi:hypothetical protein
MDYEVYTRAGKIHRNKRGNVSTQYIDFIIANKIYSEMSMRDPFFSH